MLGSGAICSTGGGIKPVLSSPGSVPVLKPALMRHSRHNPNGTPGGRGFWQPGQMRFVSITMFPSTLYLGNSRPRLHEKIESNHPTQAECSPSFGQHGKQMPQLLVHLARFGDRLCDLIPQQFPVALAQ